MIIRPFFNLGKNNIIAKNVKIYENVTIGNNNKIYEGSIIYPNTIIGDNNIILNNNVIGEHPIDSTEIFSEKIYKGIEIGNNNFFHVNNIIFGGKCDKTIIGNYNKILAENHIAHDVKINNHVTIYPRTLLGGFVKLMDYSSTGAGTFIHQRKTIGTFSFTGMNSTITKNSFPFYININNKYSKLNYHKLLKYDDYNDINNYENTLNEILNLHHNNCLNLKEYYDKLPKKIYNDINSFLSYT